MQPSSQRGGAVGTILLVLGILTLVGVSALLRSGARFIEGFDIEERRTANGESVKLKTPVGSVRVQSHHRLSTSSLGVPMYPGATQIKDNQGATIEFESDHDSKGFSVVAGIYTTPDSVDQVRSFFKKEMPHWILTSNGIEYTESGYKRIISIRRKHGLTHIALASVGEPAAN